MIVSFDINGQLVSGASDASVWREGNMLFVEFINYVYLPIEIEVRSKGLPFLSVGGVDLGIISDTKYDTIVLEVQSNIKRDVFEVDCCFYILKGDKIRWKTRINVNRVTGITCGSVTVSWSLIERAMKRLGVHPPKSLVYGPTRGNSASSGLTLDIKSGFVLVGFQNGLKFPIFKIEKGYRVVSDMYTFSTPEDAALLLRVVELGGNFVEFEMQFREPYRYPVKVGRVFVDSSGARTDHGFLSSRDITKLVVLKCS